MTTHLKEAMHGDVKLIRQCVSVVLRKQATNELLSERMCKSLAPPRGDNDV